MGTYIRYIHNRDLAAENIMTAVVRQRVILDCFPRAARNMLMRLRNAGFSLPARSTLALADQTRHLGGQAPGDFGVELRQSRRNARKADERELVRTVLPMLKALLKRLNCPAAYKPATGLRACIAMTAGVILNGRQYKQGSHAEYLPVVKRRGNLAGPGGEGGSSTSHRVATVHMFYHFTMQGSRPETYRGGVTLKALPDEATFAIISDRVVHDKIRSMHIVDAVRDSATKPGFKFKTAAEHTIIHIDSITAKVMLVPHFDATQNHLMCAIPMWIAR